MSIQQVQTKNLLEFIAQAYFVNGVNPDSEQIYSNLSKFFAAHPAGTPLDIDVNIFAQEQKSDVELMNDFLALMVVNMDTLYEVCDDQIEQTLLLHTVLRTHLDRLKIKRQVLEQKIDDYLLGIYNSDGYFYSVSDGFAYTANVDFKYTSAFVDTASTLVTLPSISSMSQTVNPAKVGDPSIKIVDQDGNQLGWEAKTEFANAIDGMTNTAWFFEVKTPSFGPITATIDIQLATSLGRTEATKIDVTPYGVTPVQCGINAMFTRDNNTTYTQPFSNYVHTSTEKISFVGDQINDNLEKVVIQLTKSEADYTVVDGHTKSNVYIFGFRELLITEQYYDPYATLVTYPFGIPTELSAEAAIDAVSLVAQDYTPTNTSIKYYVAADNPVATTVSDFDWKEISPISATISNENTIIRFDGSYSNSKMLRRSPRIPSDGQLIEFNSTSADLAKRNPTPAYLPGIDVYRLAPFKEDLLAGTLKLEEGINTTRMFYIDYDEDAVAGGFAFWKNVFDDPESYSTSYGETDSGHEFFYGADVGEDYKSVYVETFLETDKEYPVFLKECRKSDVNSKLWELRVFLNGREIANMPVGTDKLTIPWKLKEGVNHIVMMINIPEATSGSPSPYIGTFNMMADSNLTDFGIVKLDNWTYVDLYKFQNNQVNNANSFTIYNDELISRKKPTNNFRLSFKKPTSSSPEAIRLRVDMARTNSYAKSTPVLDSYRVRFSYA